MFGLREVSTWQQAYLGLIARVLAMGRSAGDTGGIGRRLGIPSRSSAVPASAALAFGFSWAVGRFGSRVVDNGSAPRGSHCEEAREEKKLEPVKHEASALE